MFSNRAIRNRIDFYQKFIVGTQPTTRQQISENAEIKRLQEDHFDEPADEQPIVQNDKDEIIRRLQARVQQLEEQGPGDAGEEEKLIEQDPDEISETPVPPLTISTQTVNIQAQEEEPQPPIELGRTTRSIEIPGRRTKDTGVGTSKFYTGPAAPQTQGTQIQPQTSTAGTQIQPQTSTAGTQIQPQTSTIGVQQVAEFEEEQPPELKGRMTQTDMPDIIEQRDVGVGTSKFFTGPAAPQTQQSQTDSRRTRHKVGPGAVRKKGTQTEPQPTIEEIRKGIEMELQMENMRSREQEKIQQEEIRKRIELEQRVEDMMLEQTLRALKPQFLQELQSQVGAITTDVAEESLNEMRAIENKFNQKLQERLTREKLRRLPVEEPFFASNYKQQVEQLKKEKKSLQEQMSKDDAEKDQMYEEMDKIEAQLSKVQKLYNEALDDKLRARRKQKAILDMEQRRREMMMDETVIERGDPRQAMKQRQQEMTFGKPVIERGDPRQAMEQRQQEISFGRPVIISDDPRPVMEQRRQELLQERKDEMIGYDPRPLMKQRRKELIKERQTKFEDLGDPFIDMEERKAELIDKQEINKILSQELSQAFFDKQIRSVAEKALAESIPDFDDFDFDEGDDDDEGDEGDAAPSQRMTEEQRQWFVGRELDPNDFSKPEVDGSRGAAQLAVIDKRIDIFKLIGETEEGRQSWYQADENGITPAYNASMNNSLEIFKLIGETEQGRQTWYQADVKGNTPAHNAATFKNTEMFKLIGETEEGRQSWYQADVNGNTPAHKAAFSNAIEIFKLIGETEEGKQAWIQPGGKNYPPKWFAEKKKNKEIIKIIEEYEKSQQSQTQMTEEQRQWFVNNGFDINDFTKTDRYGYTPANNAAQEGKTQIFKMIIETEEGRKSLLQADYSKQTPAHWAIQEENTKIVKMIIETEEGRRSLLQANDDGWTPIYWAVKEGNTEIFKLIIGTAEGRKSLLEIDHIGRTPAHMAALKGKTEILEILIGTEEGRRSLLQAETKDGDTPAHLAALSGNTEIVRMIMETEEGKKSLLQENYEYYTPRKYAQAKSHKEIIKMIRKYEKSLEPKKKKKKKKDERPMTSTSRPGGSRRSGGGSRGTFGGFGKGSRRRRPTDI